MNAVFVKIHTLELITGNIFQNPKNIIVNHEEKNVKRHSKIRCSNFTYNEVYFSCKTLTCQRRSNRNRTGEVRGSHISWLSPEAEFMNVQFR